MVTQTAGKVGYTELTDLWQSYPDLLLQLARDAGATAVAELGAGANPLVGDSEKWGFVDHRVVIDISANELEKASTELQTQVADLCQPIATGHNSYDLVFSNMLCEHLPNPRTFHENCFKLLRPGGLSVHFFPTLFAFPFVVNKMIPEKVAHEVMIRIHRERLEHGKFDKFPAYYRWTTGPTSRAMKRFESVGFEVANYYGTFGHQYYYQIPPLSATEFAKARFLLRHPAPALTSYAVVVLRKPAAGQ